LPSVQKRTAFPGQKCLLGGSQREILCSTSTPRRRSMNRLSELLRIRAVSQLHATEPRLRVVRADDAPQIRPERPKSGRATRTRIAPRCKSWWVRYLDQSSSDHSADPN